MSSSQLAKEVVSIVERKVLGERPSMQFEMANQMKVAGERIRFALKLMHMLGANPTVQEISLQLLDALERMDDIDRRFQRYSFRSTRNATFTKLRHDARRPHLAANAEFTAEFNKDAVDHGRSR